MLGVVFLCKTPKCHIQKNQQNINPYCRLRKKFQRRQIYFFDIGFVNFHMNLKTIMVKIIGLDMITPQRDPWAKIGAQLATGSGKTKIMGLVIAWSYLNAVIEGDKHLGIGKHSLVIAPNLFVLDRLLEDFSP